MNPIYLSRVVISDFRSYGPGFELKLPEGRGLTIIVGSNGLGKTGMFEAIEWALTGGIERLDGIDSSRREKNACLIRHGSGNESPLVKLWFSDGEYISRGRIQSTSAQKIRDVLVAPGWEGLNDLGVYLRFTHFLGQSSSHRFAARTPEDRWRYVEGPTNIQDLWALEQRLGRPKISAAFNSIEKELIGQLEMHKRELVRLEELLSHQEITGKLARASGAIDSEQSNLKLLNLFKELTTLAPDLAVPDMKHDTNGLFEQLADKLELVRSRLAEKRILLEGLRPLALEYPALKKDTGLVQSKIKALLQEIEQGGRAQSLAREIEAKQRAAWESLRGEIKELESRLSLLSSLRTGVQSAALKQASLTKLGISLAEHIEKRRQILPLIVEKQSEINGNVELQVRRTGLIESRARIEALKRKYDDFVKAQERYQVCNAELKAASASRDSLEAKREDLVMRLEGLDRKKNEIEDRIQKMRVKTDNMLSALTIIAANITDAEINCPVCGTPHVKGALMSLARSAAERANPELTKLELEAAELENVRDRISGELNTINNTLLGIKVKEDSLSDVATYVADSESELRLSPELQSMPHERFANSIREKCETINQDIMNVESLISTSRNQAELVSEKAKLDAQLGEIDSAIQKLNTRMQEITNEVRDISTQIHISRTNCGIGENDPQILIDKLLAERQRLSEKLPNLESNLMDASKKCFEANENITVLESMVHELRASLADKELQATVSLEKWRREDTSGSPSLDGWQKLMDGMETDGRQLDLLFKKHRSLLESYEAWQRHRMLQECKDNIEAMARQYSVTNSAELSERLSCEVKQAETKLLKLSTTKAKRNQLAHLIHESNEEVFSEILKPLNESIAAISAALLPDHRDRVAVEARLRKANACIQFNLCRDDVDERLNPELYLSEGQMSAFNISFLISASVTYPWSRWKAIILDDPLQHADVIRSAAFIDLLRNMISDQGYQVILSSHDVDEANYFLRKCNNAGIPTAYCHLLAQSDNGVVWSAG